MDKTMVGRAVESKIDSHNPNFQQPFLHLVAVLITLDIGQYGSLAGLTTRC